MIYFDNAATTFFKPPQVIDCVLDSLKIRQTQTEAGTVSRSRQPRK